MTDKRLVEVLATFFYLGKVPIVPGTFGTAGAVPLVIVLGSAHPALYLAAALAVCAVSIYVAQRYESHFGVHDSRRVVIDEVAGFVVTMMWLPVNAQTLIVAFVLFRLLDIIKPYPINIIDRKVHGGFGVVMDDVAAGVVANVILQVVTRQTNWLS